MCVRVCECDFCIEVAGGAEQAAVDMVRGSLRVRTQQHATAFQRGVRQGCPRDTAMSVVRKVAPPAGVSEQHSITTEPLNALALNHAPSTNYSRARPIAVKSCWQAWAQRRGRPVQRGASARAREPLNDRGPPERPRARVRDGHESAQNGKPDPAK